MTAAVPEHGRARLSSSSSSSSSAAARHAIEARPRSRTPCVVGGGCGAACGLRARCEGDASGWPAKPASQPARPGRPGPVRTRRRTRTARRTPRARDNNYRRKNAVPGAAAVVVQRCSSGAAAVQCGSAAGCRARRAVSAPRASTRGRPALEKRGA